MGKASDLQEERPIKIVSVNLCQLQSARISEGMSTARIRFGSSGCLVANTRTSRPSTSTAPMRRIEWLTTKLLLRHSMIELSTSMVSPYVAD